MFTIGARYREINDADIVIKTTILLSRDSPYCRIEQELNGDWTETEESATVSKALEVFYEQNIKGRLE